VRQAFDLLAKVSDALATFAFAGFLCAIIAQIAYRYIGISMVWSEELARLLNVYMVFFGVILVTARRGHLKIDVLERTITSPAVLRILRISHLLLALVFLLCLAYGAYLLTVSSWGHRLATMAWANHGLFYLAPLIGSLLSAALIILQIVEEFDPASPQQDGPR
jgi:TRAP-type C4-dicarboxylate transport system permease small subunit